MSISEEVPRSDPQAIADGRSAAELEQWMELLRQGFGSRPALVDVSTATVHCAGDQPGRDWYARLEILREVARRGRPEFIDDEDPFFVLAVPLGDAGDGSVVAVATFVTRGVEADEDLSRAAGLLEMNVREASLWAARQVPWPPDALERMAELVLDRVRLRRRIGELEAETDSLSVHLSDTYEEISLLYRLTQNLKISQSDDQLARIALEWLNEVLPASALAIQLLPLSGDDASPGHEARSRPVLLTHGECPVDNQQFSAILAHLGPGATNRPLVVNRPVTGKADWPCAQVRQMIAVSLAEGDNLFGWLAAFNHVEDDEFGTVEASLLSSVAAILGIHGGNIELYRQQSELLAGIVRALTSAIDAKDPYTCGHSDRVARVAVRLAEELGCDAETLETIYLSGLLHDIGKIGIDDSVLRKPGKLTDEEYAHIKRHPEVGHRILHDLGKLGDVLPVVLHHHESWDGGGYPKELRSEHIPLAARIVAVADAFDAMGSDRPYRNGMPDEKIDQIFREGAGRQWDPAVVDALFRAREDIRKIALGQQQGAPIELPQLK